MWLFPVYLHAKPFFCQFQSHIPNTFSKPSISITFKYCFHHFIICMLTFPYTMISMRRSAYLILFCRLAGSINTKSLSILRSLRVRLSAPIIFTSRQAQHIYTSHASPNSLVLIFYKCFFQILSDLLGYVHDVFVGQNRMYIYNNIVKQVGPFSNQGLYLHLVW